MNNRKPYFQTLETLKAKCEEVGDCWIWSGAHDGQGRPVVVNAGKRIGARRLARQLTDGREVQPHLKVGSTCGDIRCISPCCSVVVTNKTLHRMAVERGSYKNPERDRRMAMARRASSPFGEEVIRLVREAESASKAAELTGMSASHAKAIRAGKARVDYSNPFAGLGA